jgi:hypothetical protein
MKSTILTKLSQFDSSEPEWCLPPKFWERAFSFSCETIFPLGVMQDFLHRKCHPLSIRVYQTAKSVPDCDVHIATGYAFSSGLWFRHTWVVNPADKTLLECTPTKFDEYYGVCLSHKECGEFIEILGEA